MKNSRFVRINLQIQMERTYTRAKSRLKTKKGEILPEAVTEARRATICPLPSRG